MWVCRYRGWGTTSTCLLVDCFCYPSPQAAVFFAVQEATKGIGCTCSHYISSDPALGHGRRRLVSLLVSFVQHECFRLWPNVVVREALLRKQKTYFARPCPHKVRNAHTRNARTREFVLSTPSSAHTGGVTSSVLCAHTAHCPKMRRARLVLVLAREKTMNKKYRRKASQFPVSVHLQM